MLANTSNPSEDKIILGNIFKKNVPDKPICIDGHVVEIVAYFLLLAEICFRIR